MERTKRKKDELFDMMSKLGLALNNTVSAVTGREKTEQGDEKKDVSDCRVLATVDHNNKKPVGNDGSKIMESSNQVNPKREPSDCPPPVSQSTLWKDKKAERRAKEQKKREEKVEEENVEFDKISISDEED